ncbi:MAG: iron-sulfur cluster assembly protein [Pseudomonadota bacterium]|nr:iron-sulfur cluster assembly protein [Pseudomonadota bacterium]
MWGNFNLFKRRKSVEGEKQPAGEVVAADFQSDVRDEGKLGDGHGHYSPTPWNDHQSVDAPDVEMEAGVVANAGASLSAGAKVAPRESIVEALKTVYDPEIPVDIYELGLIYEINIELNGDLRLVMTLTAPGCPVAGILPQQVADAAAAVTGVGAVEVSLVWDPPWDMEKMSEDAKLALDMF